MVLIHLRAVREFLWYPLGLMHTQWLPAFYSKDCLKRGQPWVDPPINYPGLTQCYFPLRCLQLGANNKHPRLDTKPQPAPDHKSNSWLVLN